VLRCLGLTKYFGAVRAIDNVSFELRAGEVVALVGDNGAGKSTLVRVISGLHQPDSGEIWLGDRKLTHLYPALARDLGIETVHQQLALCDNLDAAANIILGREPVKFRLGPFRFVDRRRAIAEAAEGLATLGTRIDSFSVPVRRFSGGQRQGISVARATGRGGRVMIFDEPTAALGVRQKRTTLDLVRRVADGGRAALLISHNLDEVFEVADRVIVLRLGSVVLERPAAQLSPEDAVAAMTGLHGALERRQR